MSTVSPVLRYMNEVNGRRNAFADSINSPILAADIADGEIFGDVFVENRVHHFPAQHLEEKLFNKGMNDRKNSCACLVKRTLPNLVK